MQTISNIMKNAPMTPQETVVYWTEYIIRHKGAVHLKTPEADIPLYQNFLLDLLLVPFTVLLLFPLLVYWVLKKVH